MQLMMKWLAVFNHEVIGSHVKHFLPFVCLFIFTSNNRDFVSSFKLGNDMIRSVLNVTILNIV